MKKTNWTKAMGIDWVYSNQISDSKKPNDTNDHSHLRNLRSVSSIDQLKELVMSFDGCELKKLAKNTVFSDGISTSKIMLIGEAPGANEDIQGIPFCGDSGKLLDKILASIGLSRTTNVYISNCVFWRPPNNRPPTKEEVQICMPFVEKHIALVKPRILILVGTTAMRCIFGDSIDPITKSRGKIYKYTNCYMDSYIDTMVLYHPAYLLRQPHLKKHIWHDIITLSKIIKGHHHES